jgi:hypothetical protein
MIEDILQPGHMDGHEGLRRTHSGLILNMADWRPFETSERFEGVQWSKVLDHLHILYSWRLSFARAPERAELQQLARLDLLTETTTETLATSTVHTLLTEQRVTERVLQKAQHINITLLEHPVEGAGLRVHLRGLERLPQEKTR